MPAQSFYGLLSERGELPLLPKPISGNWLFSNLHPELPAQAAAAPVGIPADIPATKYPRLPTHAMLIWASRWFPYTCHVQVEFFPHQIQMLKFQLPRPQKGAALKDRIFKEMIKLTRDL